MDPKTLQLAQNFDLFFQEIQNNLLDNSNSETKDRIHKAYDYASEKHHLQLRKDKVTPYFVHPVEVALIVSKQKDPAMIIAALLHDIVEDTDTPLKEIYSEFGKEIGLIVEGMTKDLKKRDKSKREQAILMFQKISKYTKYDGRVLTVKIADRYSNLTTVEKLGVERAKQYLDETEELFLPIVAENHVSFYISEIKDIIRQKRIFLKNQNV